MSEGLKTAFISGGISLIVAVITALITSKLTLKQEVKKSVYTKRETAYSELLDLLFAFKDNPYLVYNDQGFIKPLSNLRTRLNIFASQEVLDILEPFYDRAKATAHTYWERFSGEEYESIKQARIEHGDATELDVEHEEEEYQAHNLFENAFIDDTIVSLVAAMRKDMGTVYHHRIDSRG